MKSLEDLDNDICKLIEYFKASNIPPNEGLEIMSLLMGQLLAEAKNPYDALGRVLRLFVDAIEAYEEETSKHQ